MIDRLIDNKSQCSGCYACFNVCPQRCVFMQEDAEGFVYPKVDYSSCISCEKCINVCPSLHFVDSTDDFEISAYACYNKDEFTRKASSSGGVFSHLAMQTLSQDGVVFGVTFDEKNEAIYYCVDRSTDLYKIQGSKYVQSIVGYEYNHAKHYLERGKKVLFSGLPCQIVALERCIGKKPDNLLCVDFICQGVPSPLVWRKYLERRMEKSRGNRVVTHINFRSKKKGWNKYSMNIQYLGRKQYIKDKYHDPYIGAYTNYLSIRPSCYSCLFKGRKRSSDITLGDFWGVQKIAPSMYDNKGTSLVIINSQKGKHFFEQNVDQLICEEVDMNLAVASNPMYYKSVPRNEKRNVFFVDLMKHNFDKAVKKNTKSLMGDRLRQMILLIKSGIDKWGMVIREKINPT